MVKVFTTNKNNKIELTKDELQKLLDEAYWEGFYSNGRTWTYTSPSVSPYIWTATVTANSTTGAITGSSYTVTSANNESH